MQNRKSYIRINAALWSLFMVAAAFIISSYMPEATRKFKILVLFGQMTGWLMMDAWLKKRFDLKETCCW